MQIDWVAAASEIFKVNKPAHFTEFEHCDECAEHDQTLSNADVESIGLQELGNPGWDPMCFATVDAKMYYLPALIRLSLETMNSEFYLEQFLFHLMGGGIDNPFYHSCSNEQKKFIASFIQHLIENHADEIEAHASTYDVLNCYEIWSQRVD